MSAPVVSERVAIRRNRYGQALRALRRAALVFAKGDPNDRLALAMLSGAARLYAQRIGCPFCGGDPLKHSCPDE